MIHAYSETYLSRAQKALGYAADYYINIMSRNPEDFTDLFLGSGIAKEFGRGNPIYVAGLSGVELLERMIFLSYPDKGFPDLEPIRPSQTASREYWAGWALSYYQWYTCRSFESILRSVSFEEIVSMYAPFHEMDPEHFVESMEGRYARSNGSSKLKMLRERNQLSQSELSAKSGVKLRMIQLYEQKRNDINRAQSNTLHRLALVLNCSVDDLLDDPVWAGELIFDGEY